MKGLLQTFEAIIAVFAIFSFFLIFYAPKEPLPEFDTINWELKGINALKALDDNNELRSFAIGNDTTTIKTKLSPLLPPEVSYEIVICELNCTALNIDASKVASVNYLIAGNVGDLKFKQIILYMWS